MAFSPGEVPVRETVHQSDNRIAEATWARDPLACSTWDVPNVSAEQSSEGHRQCGEECRGSLDMVDQQPYLMREVAASPSSPGPASMEEEVRISPVSSAEDGECIKATGSSTVEDEDIQPSHPQSTQGGIHKADSPSPDRLYRSVPVAAGPSPHG